MPCKFVRGAKKQRGWGSGEKGALGDDGRAKDTDELLQQAMTRPASALALLWTARRA